MILSHCEKAKEKVKTFSMRMLLVVSCLFLSFAVQGRWWCPWKIAGKVRPPETFAEWLQLSKQSRIQPFSIRPVHFDKPFLIIGGGPGGLAAASAFTKARLPFLLIERHTEFGGLWNQTNPQSPAYKSLIANSSYLTTHLGKPFNPGKSGYPSALEAKKYLIEFADSFGIRDFTQFGTSIKGQIAFNERSDLWSVILQNSTHHIYDGFSGVIVASGKHSKETAYIPPEMKKQVSDSGIPSIHAAYYQSPDFYRGQNVLIRGLGNSSAEIAAEVSKVANKVIISTRSTPWGVPLYIRKILGLFGKYIPTDEFAMSGPKLPHWLEMFFFHLLQRKYVGHPKDFGFTKKPDGLLDKIPISDRGFFQAILEGRILIQPEVDAIQNRIAVFNGKPLEQFPIDSVIFATGYTRQVPFISKEMVNFDDPDFRLAFNIFHPTQKTLFFMSELQVPQGGWSMLEREANAIAAYALALQAGGPRVSEFLNIKNKNFPNFKGRLFKKGDHYHADPEITSKFLTDFADWLREDLR